MTAITESAGAATRPQPSFVNLWAVLRLGGPLTAFFALQSVTTLTSLAMVGRLGNVALAGVGPANAFFGVLLALLFGVDAAVQVLISRRTGAGRADEFGQVLIDALTLSLPLGAVLSLCCGLVGPALLDAVLPAPAAAAGVACLRASAPSLLLLALSIPINSCWIGSGRPKLALLVCIILAPLQIAATALLIFGFGPIPNLGPGGAGLAMSVAALGGAALQLWLVTRPGALPGLRAARPTPAGAASIASLAWPISLQQGFLQLGMTSTYMIVAQLGIASVAAANVLINLTQMPAQLAVGLGVAGGTLVGYSLGQADVPGARLWGWRAMALALAVCAPFTLAALLFPGEILSLFVKDAATRTLAEWPLRVIGVAVAFDTVARGLCFAIRGAGATKIGAGVPFASQWLAQLPLQFLFAVSLGFGLIGLALVQVAVAAIEAMATAAVWAGAAWAPRSVAQAVGEAAIPEDAA